jgi:2-oxoglutarate ferredoxin oxidoreductase subunit gamma
MEQQVIPARHEVILAGLGGKGVLTAGLVLAQAAMRIYPHVLWFPTYASAMRGGSSECTVVFAAAEIASPILPQAEGIIILSPSQFKAFERRVRPGGVLMVESSGFQPEAQREDVRLLLVPAVTQAMELGDSRMANLVLLGAYLEATRVLPLPLVEEALERRFAAEAALARSALRRGAELMMGERER